MQIQNNSSNSLQGSVGTIDQETKIISLDASVGKKVSYLVPGFEMRGGRAR